jgi:Na+/melibiose symporter-like transporter
LQFTGFKSEGLAQNQATLECAHAAFTFIPAFFAVIAIIMIARYPITREKHAEIIRELGRRGDAGL